MALEVSRGPWPLVGRAEECRLVADAIGDGRGAIVGGRPGMGRSRLAEESVRLLRDSGHTVIQLWGIEALAHRPLAALALSLEVDGPDDDPRAMWRHLVARAAAGPLGVVVDDAHHLDTVSAEILLLLARRGQAVVIATVRSQHQLPSPIGGLRKDLGAVRLDLLPLGRGETAALARHALGAEVDGELLQELWRLVRGNPLYLRELLSDRATLAAMVAEGGVVRLRRPLPVTAGLDEVVQMRLSGLGTGARRALEMLALRPLPLVRLLRLVDPADLAVVERDGLVIVPTDATKLVRISLPLHAEVLRAGLPQATRRALEELIGQDEPEVDGASSADAMVDDSRRLLHSQPHRAERLARTAYRQDPGERSAVALAHSLASGGRLDEADSILATFGLPASHHERVALQTELTGADHDPAMEALRLGDPSGALALLADELTVAPWQVPSRRRWALEARLWRDGPDAVAEEAVAWFHSSLGHSLVERGHAALALGTVAYWQGQHAVASARLGEAARLLVSGCAEGHGQAVVMRAWIRAGGGATDGGGGLGSDLEAVRDRWWRRVGSAIEGTDRSIDRDAPDALGAALVTHGRGLLGGLLTEGDLQGPVMAGQLGDGLRVAAAARASSHRPRRREARRLLPVGLHWMINPPVSTAISAAPPRPAVPTRPGGLTSRELEVARLAAAGRTDVEIAHRLVLSPRTVQTHLARVYRKLGVSGRRSLTSALSGTIAASANP